MQIKPKKILIESFKIAVGAAQPGEALPPHLPIDKSHSAIIIGAGKAAASMAASFEKSWNGPVSGMVVTPYGHNENCNYIDVVEAAHPTPDNVSRTFAKNVLNLTKNLTEDDHVYVLLSGGGSSLLSLPASGIEFDDKKVVNNALLKSGASINEINTVRKHLSQIKGGRLAAHCYPSNIHTYIISDVMGDDPAVVASGPTVADPTTSKDAAAIINKYNIAVPNSIVNWLNDPLSESIKPNNPMLENSKYTIVATAKDALAAVVNYSEKLDIECINLGEQGCDSRKLGNDHGNLVLNMKPIEPTLILSGGETTVTVKGDGKGGRNTEYLLSLVLTLNGARNVYAISADTDGIDGSEDNAGAYIDFTTLKRAASQNMDLVEKLDNNDSYTAFHNLGDLINTGPTRTNVNDFRAILILPD